MKSGIATILPMMPCEMHIASIMQIEAICQIALSPDTQPITLHTVIPCSDRHFYCVNNATNAIIEINILYKISINYCSIKM